VSGTATGTPTSLHDDQPQARREGAGAAQTGSVMRAVEGGLTGTAPSRDARI